MGYDLHITRGETHSTNEGHEITAEEWLRYVASDPELRLVPENGEHFVRWSGTSIYADPWFDWWAGKITTKNPDRAILAKMLLIARALGARVQGDDGEWYDEATGVPE